MKAGRLSPAQLLHLGDVRDWVGAGGCLGEPWLDSTGPWRAAGGAEVGCTAEVGRADPGAGAVKGRVFTFGLRGQRSPVGVTEPLGKWIDTARGSQTLSRARREVVWWQGRVGKESEVAQSCPTLCDPWTVAHQAPPSMGFSRQECWSRVPFPSPGHLPKPGFFPSQGSNRGLPHCRQTLYRLSGREKVQQRLGEWLALPSGASSPRAGRAPQGQ